MGNPSLDNMVEPLPGLAPWVGGKRNLATRIVGKIETTPHICYVEPFVGMGGIFFKRTRRPAVEVVNDLSGDVVNLFRVAQNHPMALVDQLATMLFAREEFERMRSLDPETLTDIQRAARFFYLQRACFGGVVGNGSFPAAPSRNKALPRATIERQIMAQFERLDCVTIERLPYAEVIARYDRPGTLFYLDPPYWGCESYYGKGLFAREDFGRLAEILASLTGRFILSLNDVPPIRKLFRRFRIETLPVTYKFTGNKRTTELLILGGGTGSRRRRDDQPGQACQAAGLP